ncbi:RNA polymerase sigma factor CnrH [Posidoniimonas polymericola]|uniref:RNA polymerase sigma factor CnrH n=1 Tax=Posidoniimonas polymericola TaxID=2528002 RepID=A0A5C5YII0_9BACT|nr:RNA polymerase sigma factor [Posidoniimonas polymericola]TWT74685.1 RNA polymerase sigma factor CnrH [Posidoniimonas polymericola]
MPHAQPALKLTTDEDCEAPAASGQLAAEPTDAQLLARFAAERDEHAFGQLVERHGPLVLGVCRRNTFCPEDAEDAFQATFLVLAESVRKIRRRASLSAWLYGVALRVSGRVRRAGPHGATQNLEGDVVLHADPLDELLARHDGMVADEELTALPDKLRRPLVLRYLAGKSNVETAAELGISVAALEGRLKRGKSELRARLRRRGVTLAAVVAVLKATRAEAALPESLISTATAVACGGTGTTAELNANPTVNPIAAEELSAMHALGIPKLLIPLTAAGVAVLALGVHLAYSQGTDEGGGAVPLQHAVEQVVSESEFAVAAAPASQSSPEPAIAPVQNPPASALMSRLRPQSESVAKIEAALSKPLTRQGLEFLDIPLEECIDFLRNEYEIEIQLDEKAFDDLGIGTDEPVTINLRNISLESALNLMLARLDLTHVIANEVLLITGQEEAETHSSTKLYPTSRLGYDAEQLRQTFITIVAPHTWSENKGEAEIEALSNGDLLVRQTYAGHRELAKVLEQLAAVPPGEQAAEPKDRDDQVTTRVYQASDLGIPPKELQELVAAVVQPDTWADESRAGINASGEHGLVVSQSESTHKQINALLQLVRRAKGAAPAAETATTTPDNAARERSDDLLQSLLRRREEVLREVQRKQDAYEALAQESGSIVDPQNAVENQLDVVLLTKLQDELLSLRRMEALEGKPSGDFRQELEAEVDSIEQRLRQRSSNDTELQRRREEIEQLQQVAAELSKQIEDLKTEQALRNADE